MDVNVWFGLVLWCLTPLSTILDVKEHERLSNTTLRHELKQMNGMTPHLNAHIKISEINAFIILFHIRVNNI
jgi:hypothetical protein